MLSKFICLKFRCFDLFGVNVRGVRVKLFYLLMLSLFATITHASAGQRFPGEFSAMLDVLCDETSDVTSKGCRHCPSYMRDDPRQELRGELEFSEYLDGSFTGINKSEVLLVSYMSCYDHASGFGSIVLMRKDRRKWEKVFFSHVGGSYQKIPGRKGHKDLLLRKSEDWGRGSVDVVGIEESGEVSFLQELVQQWVIPFRELNPRICSAQEVDVKKITTESIDLQVKNVTFVPEPESLCVGDDKGRQFNLHFYWLGKQFVPDSSSKKLLEQFGNPPEHE
jgi:hypothetical protein